MRGNGTRQRQVTHCAPRWCFGNLGSTWSPDGRWILFERDQRNGAGENRPGLFLIKPDGTDMHRLTRAPIDRDTSHSDPQYSPDGRWIVFTQIVHESDVPNHLFIISADGGAARRLTPLGLDSDTADWSPDGRWIVFGGHPRVPGVDFTANVYVIHPDGSGMRRLTHSTPGEGFDFFASWSPNGARIVFNHVGPHVDDLFTMNGRGTAIRRVTHTENVFEVNADWGARTH
jgi:TolB protein